jgi:glutamate-1-semialdehyde 2,1-aminomutase
MGSDRVRFGKFFHGCLEEGVYFAPSQFEAGFLCTAHSVADIEQTADVVKKNLARVF